MTPLWKWRPAPLRWLALAIYLPFTVVMFVLAWLLRAVFSGFMDFLWELAYAWPGRAGLRGGWVWVRATWRGEHVGEALMREYGSRHDND